MKYRTPYPRVLTHIVGSLAVASALSGCFGTNAGNGSAAALTQQQNPGNASARTTSTTTSTSSSGAVAYSGSVGGDSEGGFIRIDPRYVVNLANSESAGVRGGTSQPVIVGSTTPSISCPAQPFVVGLGGSVVYNILLKNITTNDSITLLAETTNLSGIQVGKFIAYPYPGGLEVHFQAASTLALDANVAFHVAARSLIAGTTLSASCLGTVDVPEPVVAVEPPAVEQPAVNPPVVDEPVVNPPVAEQPPAVNPPVVDQPVVNPPVAEEPPAVIPPVVYGPVELPPVIEQPVVNPPVVDQPVVNPPVAEQPVVNPPVAEQPAVNPPVVDEPVVNPPVAEQPAEEPPVAEQPVAPIDEVPIAEEPVLPPIIVAPQHNALSLACVNAGDAKLSLAAGQTGIVSFLKTGGDDEAVTFQASAGSLAPIADAYRVAFRAPSDIASNSTAKVEVATETGGTAYCEVSLLKSFVNEQGDAILVNEAPTCGPTQLFVASTDAPLAALTIGTFTTAKATSARLEPSTGATLILGVQNMVFRANAQTRDQQSWAAIVSHRDGSESRCYIQVPGVGSLGGVSEPSAPPVVQQPSAPEAPAPVIPDFDEEELAQEEEAAEEAAEQGDGTPTLPGDVVYEETNVGVLPAFVRDTPVNANKLMTWVQYRLREPFARLFLPDINFATRSFDQGFLPGVNKVEWFQVDVADHHGAIIEDETSGRAYRERHRGWIRLPAAGIYEFALNSDDGARAYIGGRELINNDGLHAPAVVKSRLEVLKAGERRIRFSYYQGPRYHIAFQFLWRLVSAKKGNAYVECSKLTGAEREAFNMNSCDLRPVPGAQYRGQIVRRQLYKLKNDNKGNGSAKDDKKGSSKK